MSGTSSVSASELERRINTALLMLDSLEVGLLRKTPSASTRAISTMIIGLRATLTSGADETTARLNNLMQAAGYRSD